MQFTNYLLIYKIVCCVLVTGVLSCGNATDKQVNNSKNTTTTTTNTSAEYITTASGKKIPKAENGITVVSETGWTADQMTFHQDYCQQMMASLEGYDVSKFCTCFLEKIQYYYQPIHFKEAYTDQQKWNQNCLQDAAL